MKNIVNALLMCMLFAVMVIGGLSILNAQTSISNAREYKDAIVTEIEDSNFSASVINACGQQAIDNDYKLSVVLYKDDDTTSTCIYGNDVIPATDTKGVYMADVVLTYTYDIPIFSIKSDRYIRGCAR